MVGVKTWALPLSVRWPGLLSARVWIPAPLLCAPAGVSLRFPPPALWGGHLSPSWGSGFLLLALEEFVFLIRKG